MDAEASAVAVAADAAETAVAGLVAMEIADLAAMETAGHAVMATAIAGHALTRANAPSTSEPKTKTERMRTGRPAENIARVVREIAIATGVPDVKASAASAAKVNSTAGVMAADAVTRANNKANAKGKVGRGAGRRALSLRRKSKTPDWAEK